MLEKIKFINHLNESIDFGEGGLYLNINELRSYKWAYSSKNNRISQFRREVKEKKLPIVVVPPNNRDEGNTIMNTLLELADKDVMNKKAGRIIAGDYYLTCYIIGSEKKDYDLRLGTFKATLTVLTDEPYWVKETKYSFDYSSGSGTEFLDYAYDLPYDFTPPSLLRVLTNTGFADTDFSMAIYGEVTDPSIYIGGHKYAVTGHIDDGEYLVIDSRNKTITLIQQDGTRVNWFRYRDKDDYIFQMIPAGDNAVAWQGDYNFDVTLFEKRSEPKWI